MKGKKILAAAVASLALLGGGLCLESGMPMASGVALAAEAEIPVWQADIDEATRDDTMAFGTYVGKPMQAYTEDFRNRGWTLLDEKGVVAFTTKKQDYAIMVVAQPHPMNKNIVGNYRIRFYGKTREMADEMYMRAEKNFSYNFGRPNVKMGTANMTWFLNDTFSIEIEYNEYDPRMPLVKKYFPYEVVIKRTMGDFGKFFAQ